jgi:hypothetical protein
LLMTAFIFIAASVVIITLFAWTLWMVRNSAVAVALILPIACVFWASSGVWLWYGIAIALGAKTKSGDDGLACGFGFANACAAGLPVGLLISVIYLTVSLAWRSSKPSGKPPERPQILP